MSLEIQTSSLGAQLISVKFNDIEMLHDRKEIWNYQAPILFPMVGKLKDDTTIIKEQQYTIRQHGFAKDMYFNILGPNRYVLKSNYITLEQYPFDFEFYVEYEIMEDTLINKFRIINKGNEEMIFGIGGHPGFKIDIENKKYYFKLEQEEKNAMFMEVDGQCISDTPAKNILIKDQFLEINDNSFNNDAIMMKNLKSKYIVLYEFENNKPILKFDFRQFPILAIWSIPKVPFICIEPWTNTADKCGESRYFREKEGMIFLSPNEEYKCQFSIEFLNNI